MNKSIYLLIFLIFAFGYSSFGQAIIDIDSVQYNYVTEYDNGQIKEIGNYTAKRSIKQGHWIVYDLNGEIIESGHYLKGKKDGIWKEKDVDNKNYWTGTYHNGKKQGQWFDGVNRIVTYKKGKEIRLKVINWY